MLKNKKKILFYGPLGKNKKFTVGGGEAGNLRTIYLLEKNSIEVVKLFKPYPEKNVIGYVVYVIRLIFILLKLIYELVTKPNIKIVHISGFYLHLIYHEYLLIFFSRVFKRKCIYELRGGGVIEAYQNRSSLYQKLFKSALNKASVILCQGKSYISFLETLTDVEVIYYPNYVLNDFLSNSLSHQKEIKSIIHLIYFGRIVQSKNVALLLDICAELKKMSLDFDLEIIGSGEQNYLDHLNKKITDLHLNEQVKILKPVENNLLKDKLLKKHFFLFPSSEKREGHSNSLTEAMAMGVVPVCSNIGFNAEIVGFKKLIVNTYDPKAYVSIINEVWRSGEWDGLSKRVANRIKENFTEKVAEDIILEAYRFQ